MKFNALPTVKVTFGRRREIGRERERENPETVTMFCRTTQWLILNRINE